MNSNVRKRLKVIAYAQIHRFKGNEHTYINYDKVYLRFC